MKATKYTLNALLAAILGIALLAVLLVDTFGPELILPRLDIPNMVFLSLAALLLEYFIVPGADHCYICIPAFAVAAFALLPWAAGTAQGMEIVKNGLVGGAVFTATTWLFSSAIERMSSGVISRRAAVVSALALYLAAQGFSGILM